MTIEQMQEAIRAKGYQWQEHVFNDGHYVDCYLQVSLSINPHILYDFEVRQREREKGYDVLGWGRFDRVRCWQMAYDYIVIGKRE